MYANVYANVNVDRKSEVDHSIVYSIRKLGGFDEKLNSPGYLYLKGVTIS